MRDELATAHGDLRLLQRASALDISMTELWEQSIDCEVAYHGYDKARVSPEYEVVLLKEDGRVVTILPETFHVTLDGEDFEDYMQGIVDGGTNGQR